MIKCDTCKMKRVCDELERMGKVPKHENCRCYSTEKPVTNADRIRSMTDEKLAEWIISITEDDTEGWLDWLKEEVSE